MRLGKKADDVGGHALADATDIDERRKRLAVGILRRLHRSPPICHRTVVTSEEPGGRLADLRDAERVDEALERDPPTLVDCRLQIAGTEIAPALALGDDVGIESEDVTRLLDQPILPEGGDVLFTEALDVKAVARDKMPEALDGLRGADQPAGATTCHLTRLAHREAAANRAVVGEFERLGILRAPL